MKYIDLDDKNYALIRYKKQVSNFVIHLAIINKDFSKSNCRIFSGQESGGLCFLLIYKKIQFAYYSGGYLIVSSTELPLIDGEKNELVLAMIGSKLYIYLNNGKFSQIIELKTNIIGGNNPATIGFGADPNNVSESPGLEQYTDDDTKLIACAYFTNITDFDNFINNIYKKNCTSYTSSSQNIGFLFHFNDVSTREFKSQVGGYNVWMNNVSQIHSISRYCYKYLGKLYDVSNTPINNIEDISNTSLSKLPLSLDEPFNIIRIE